MSLFGGENDVTLTIKAKDEASSGISSVLGSMGKLAGGFALGQLAVEGLKGAFGFLADQISSSITSFNESERVTAQTEAVLKSTGYAAGFTAEAIQAMASSLQDQTTYGDEAIKSAQNLLLTFTNIGHDIFPEAIKTVLDMSTALGQDLKSSSIQLGKALQDPIEGVNALRRVGVNFTQAQQDVIAHLVDTGKAAEAQRMIIKELNVEFGGSAAAAATTFGGQMEQLKNKIDDVKEEVGAGLTPILANLVSSFTDVTSAMFGNVNVTELTFTAFRALAETGYAVINMLIQLGAGLAATASRIGQIISVVGIFDKDLKKAFEEQQASIGKFANASEESFNKFVEKNELAQSSLNKSKDNTAAALAGMLNHTANFSTSAAKKVKDLTDTYQKLAEALQKVRQTGADELASLTKAHETAVASSTERISDLRKSLSDLSDAYARSSADATAAFTKQAKQDAQSVGDAIVAEQNKIAELRKQAGYETDPQKRILLEAELKKEEDAYAAQADFIKLMSAEVAEAKRRDALTDFERAIEDYKNKRAQADQEYADNRADAAREYAAKTAEIKLSLAQEQKKLADENAAFAKAQDAITKVLADAEALRLTTTKKSADEVIKLVDAQIDRYNKLAEAIQRASQGKPALISSAASVPVREHGGIVPGPVGTAVPIIAHGQEMVVPASKVGDSMGGGSYSIVINNPTVRSDADLNAMRQMFEDALRDVSRVHKLTTI